ncbi:hypothetical protein DXA15_09235 [Parabacteroides sp. AM58-2XD]|uniref:hypothetical protein n=1 Tax=Parabacteroides TaxID=375288 RepID=UPI000FE1A7FB|nr:MULTISPECIES: hypothetical protein [Parabacteroides]MCM0718680.1 hypothetical protein [Parabacteroides sp. W1-Q-101]RGY98465.1 hypothetical protein DXA15_09235 [Parabacteroides sp. AM58-2XD]GKG73454.1 hypothetical protein CE91St1_25970 [Parabacteroides goldsteinii]GKG79389.1 hypothetical protein CE91St2_25810 [Parabacteroides goldsteinii]
MTLIERKQKLLQRLETVFDEHLINEIEQLLDQKEQKNDILYFSSELKGKIDRALERMKAGKGVSDEEMKKRFAKWLAPEQ